jgi:hypothetical protein
VSINLQQEPANARTSVWLSLSTRKKSASPFTASVNYKLQELLKLAGAAQHENEAFCVKGQH